MTVEATQVEDSVVKLYGKWSFEGVKCQDISLKVYPPYLAVNN
jgi:hypothetical protein